MKVLIVWPLIEVLTSHFVVLNRETGEEVAVGRVTYDGLIPVVRYVSGPPEQIKEAFGLELRSHFAMQQAKLSACSNPS